MFLLLKMMGYVPLMSDDTLAGRDWALLVSALLSTFIDPLSPSHRAQVTGGPFVTPGDKFVKSFCCSVPALLPCTSLYASQMIRPVSTAFTVQIRAGLGLLIHVFQTPSAMNRSLGSHEDTPKEGEAAVRKGPALKGINDELMCEVTREEMTGDSVSGRMPGTIYIYSI